jgi:hypothetical protein
VLSVIAGNEMFRAAALSVTAAEITVTTGGLAPAHELLKREYGMLPRR